MEEDSNPVFRGGQDRGKWFYRRLSITFQHYALGASEDFEGEDTFDLVPVLYRPLMQFGKIVVENWHRFAPESEHKEGDKSYAVVDKGPETPEKEALETNDVRPWCHLPRVFFQASTCRWITLTSPTSSFAS